VGRTRATRPIPDLISFPTEILDSAASLEAVALRAVERILAASGAEGAVVEIAAAEGTLQWGQVPTGALRGARGASLSETVWRHPPGNTARICADSEVDIRVDRPACRHLRARSLVTIPLLHLGVRLGAVSALSGRAQAFDEEQVDALYDVADAVTAAAVGARVIAELRQIVADSGGALAASETRYRRMFMESPLPMWVLDAETHRFLAVNDAAVVRYGYSAEEFATLSITDLRHDGSHLAIDFHGARAGKTTYKARHRLRDGRLIDVEVTAVQQEFDGRPAVLSIVNDVTERNRLEAQLREGAFRDPLTGGANRALLEERLAHALARMRRHHRTVAVLVIGLDHFKDVNDSMGHAAGDSLIQAAAARVQTAIRPGDTVGRLGGDEFAALLEEVDGVSGALQAAERLDESFRSPLDFLGGSLVVGISIGIAIPESARTPPAELLRDAELAMHAAKAGGRGRVELFVPGMHTMAEERLRLEQDLRLAVERGELRLYLQPVVSAQSSRIVGCEALVRWQHPTRGLVPPDAFIPLAEETGLISAIDTWVLRAACAQAAAWRDAGLPELLLAVNVSGRDLGRGDLVDRISAALLVTRFSRTHLEIEITESSAVAQPQEALDELHRLRAAGIRVAIDDFGTGYSSLSKLASLPVDRLKIDRSFISEIRNEHDDAPLVAAMIGLAHRLGLAVTAEGVETPEQLAFLRHNGCDLLQGYLISPPVPTERFEALLRHSGQPETQSLSS